MKHNVLVMVTTLGLVLTVGVLATTYSQAQAQSATEFGLLCAQHPTLCSTNSGTNGGVGGMGGNGGVGTSGGSGVSGASSNGGSGGAGINGGIGGTGGCGGTTTPGNGGNGLAGIGPTPGGIVPASREGPNGGTGSCLHR
jgi:hypothetical protein